MRLPVPPDPRRLRTIATDGVRTGRDLVSVLTRIDSVVDAAQLAVERLLLLITRLEELESRLRVALQPIDVQIAVEAIGDVSRVRERLDNEVVPVMRTLDSVASDLAELVSVSKALNEMLGALPGFGRAKRRAEQDDSD